MHTLLDSGSLLLVLDEGLNLPLVAVRQALDRGAEVGGAGAVVERHGVLT